MLLDHRRVLEACWALYSLSHFSGESFDIVIHDDRSLTPNDMAALSHLFPGIRIVRRTHADEVVSGYLQRQRLDRSLAFRSALVFSLKLIDPFFFSTSDTFLLLDSDVLFFRRPDALLLALEQSIPQFSADNGYRYCLSEGDLRSLLGQDCVSRLNPGVLTATRASFDPHRLEGWLAHPGFWGSDGTASYYAELTLWAMLTTLAGGRALPDSYAICAPEPRKYVSGHYCGGGYWAALFYTRGMPFIWQSILAARSGS